MNSKRSGWPTKPTYNSDYLVLLLSIVPPKFFLTEKLQIIAYVDENSGGPPLKKKV